MELNTLEFTSDRDGRVLAFAGDMNYATIDEARKEIDQAMDAAGAPIVVDLRSVEMFTSVALQMLLEVTTGQQDALVLLIGDRIEGILEVTGIRRKFKIAHEMDEALRRAGVAD